MVVVPSLIVILGLGIVMLILIGVYHPPEFLAYTLAWCIQAMNRFVEWVASKEAFLFDQISFDLTALIFSYLILFLLGIFNHKKTFKNLIVLGVCILGFQVVVQQIPALTTKNSFIVFHKSLNCYQFDMDSFGDKPSLKGNFELNYKNKKFYIFFNSKKLSYDIHKLSNEVIVLSSDQGKKEYIQLISFPEINA